MVKLRWDVRDVFRAGRYGFSGKKFTIHFAGLLIFYLAYEGLVYLSLLLSGTGAASEFWSTYALLPVCPFVDFSGLSMGLPLLTQIAMWIGIALLFVIFFLTSTAVSKVAIEQLRGDDFYSMKESRGFMKKHGKSVFGTFLVLIFLFIFCIIWPIGVGLMGKIPAVGNVFVLLASLLLVPAFFLGLFMVLLTVVFFVSLLFTPAITAVEGQDTFENVYQLFSLLWNQPWRLFIYEHLLLLTKMLCVPVFAVASLGAMKLVLTPLQLLIPNATAQMMNQSDRWLGGVLGALQDLLPNISLSVGVPHGDASVLISIAAVFLTALWIVVALMVISYLMSVASTGNVLIYVLLRHRTSGENLLEVPEDEPMLDTALNADQESTESTEQPSADESNTEVAAEEENPETPSS